MLSQTCLCGESGTSVKVAGLFENLPVRAKQVKKRKSKEMSSIHNLLLGYAIARPDVRIMCDRYVVRLLCAAAIANSRAPFTTAHSSKKPRESRPVMLSKRCWDVASRSSCAALAATTRSTAGQLQATACVACGPHLTQTSHSLD